MDILRVLDEIPLGTARVFCCEDLAGLVERVEHAGIPDDFRLRIVGRVWSTVPPRDPLIDELLGLLADTVLATYPGWRSDDAPLSFDIDKGSAADSGRPLAESHVGAGILPEWFEAAIASCEAGESPVSQRFDRELQIRQLARVLRAERLILVTVFQGESIEESEGKVLSDLLRWLAELTGLRIAVFLTESALRRTRSLEGISYGAVRVEPEVETRRGAPAEAASIRQDSDTQVSPERSEVPADAAETIERQSGARLAAPIIGAPHPFSPAERELARRLEADKELRGLFRYNWPVQSAGGGRHIVDLLWEGGGLVLEVDGYSTHSGRRQFQNDRTRDRELLLTEYRVVRVTHDEVMRDPGGTLGLIRELVHFCRSR